MWNGVAGMRNSMEVPQEIENKTVTWFSTPTDKLMDKENYIYIYIYILTMDTYIHNTQTYKHM